MRSDMKNIADLIRRAALELGRRAVQFDLVPRKLRGEDVRTASGSAEQRHRVSEMLVAEDALRANENSRKLPRLYAPREDPLCILVCPLLRRTRDRRVLASKRR